MKQTLLIMTCLCLAASGCTQGASKNKEKSVKVGGACEGCEAIHESPIAFDQLSWVDTLPDFHESGPKLEITGTVYRIDGKTPAPNVVIYIYHTDQQGRYSTKGDEKGWGLRHGYIRGWIKTNEKGQYKFYTLRPASYPNSNNPQHIHPVVKEPGMGEYWIDEFLFTDDPLVNKEQVKHLQKRGGSGLLKPKKENGIQVATRNIILGMNVPGYPSTSKK